MRTQFFFPASVMRRLSYSALLATLLGLATLLLFPAIASAHSTHAEYVSSDPSNEQILQKAPTTITITFSEGLTHNGSDIQVYDIDHKLVSQQVQFPADVKTMSVTIQPTTDSEVYVVDWQTVSADDGDHNAGSFIFHVSATATPTNPMATSTAVALTNNTSNTNTTQTNATSSNGGLPVWLAIVIGVAALVIGGLVGAFALRRPSKG